METNSSNSGLQRRQLTIDCNTIELTNGKATSLLGFADNQISTNNYLSDSIIIRPLFRILNPCPLSLIVSILVVFTIKNSEAYTIWMYASQLFLILLLIIVKEFYFDKMRNMADQKINQSKFLMKDSKVYRDGEQKIDITWGQIRQGDILYLEKGEKAPADLIVLDTQHIQDRQALVYIDSRSITGKVTVQRKKACYLTQVTSRSAVKRNWEKYKKEYLTGKLKYELPNPNMQDFLGYLKLVKDPKTSQITFENFISRQSIIKTCWIYALVVNAGMNCKIMRHIKQRSRNHKFFQNNIDRLFSVCLIINVILGLLFSLIALPTKISFLDNIAYHLMEFSIILPHFLFLGNGMLLLYFSLKNNINAQIINYSSIINLGSIDYVVMAYNGVLSSGKMFADQIVTSSSLYDLGQENYQIVQRGSRRNGSLSGNNPRGNRVLMSISNSAYADLINPSSSLQNASNSQFGFYFLDDQNKKDNNLNVITGLHVANSANFRMPLQLLRINKQKLKKNLLSNEEQAMGLVVAFGLCHQAVLKSVDSQDIKFEANSKCYSEQVLLRLVNNICVHVSCLIDSKSKKEMGLKFKLQEQIGEKGLTKQKQFFFERKQNNFQIQRKIYSVVVRSEGQDERVIYCKGNPQDMLQKLRDKELKRNILQNQLNKFQQSKAEILIYGKRTLEKGEYQIYENQYTKLKMSSKVTSKDIEDFSTKFQKDLQFVCMVGLSSQKNNSAQEIAQYFGKKDIKMCVFTNNTAEVKSLKSLLKSMQKSAKKQNQTEYVQLQGRTVEQITYNLNSITRKLNYQKQYSYSLVLSSSSWKLLKIHSCLMQQFLFAVYYACNVLTHGFTPIQKAEITQKLKRGYNRVNTLMSIGSSYSDLLFQNFSDVSLIIGSGDGEKIHSDIPSDIRVSSITTLTKIIDLGSWVAIAYSRLLGVSIYRSALLGTVAFVLQTVVFAYQRTQYNLDSKLTFLYVVIYGALQTIFIIKLEHRNQKQKEQCNDYRFREKKINIKFWMNVLQGIAHGSIIGIVVLMTLPNARLAGGKIFPVQAVHFSIYFLMINVSIFRHLVNGQCSKISVIVFGLISYPILLGLPWLIVVFQHTYKKLSIQMITIWTTYDSVLMIINSFIFSLCCTLFIAQTKKKGIFTILMNHYRKMKKQSSKKSKQLQGKDINYIDLVKHLFADEQNIDESIQELVEPEFETNELKINFLLEFKKTEYKIKNQFNNVGLNFGRFKLTLIIIVSLFITIIIHGRIMNIVPWNHQIPLESCIFVLTFVFIWYMQAGEEIGRKYYKLAEICMTVICLTVMVFQMTTIGQDSAHFLLSCVSFVVVTQLIGIRLGIILILVSATYLTGLSSIIYLQVQDYTKKLPLQITFMSLCGVVNIVVLYGSTFDSRKNFILREQIQMQTNQTNDIWTILVPEFVRNFFAQNGEDNGQYKQKSVAILFCYVCNFNAIIEEQGTNVVRLLDNLYRQFDKLCSSFAAQKIETVGYTYMAATGIRKIENQIDNQMIKRNKVERLVNMSQQMIEKTKLFKWGVKKNKDLQIKVGIHVGEVVVGVIGKHKKQFSLIGTNVNTTSRHGSTGDEGTITLSKEAKSQLHNFPASAFFEKWVYMKGLCKNQEDRIPVYSLKAQEAGRRINNSSSHIMKFKKLVMKVIRSQRMAEKNSSQIDSKGESDHVIQEVQMPILQNQNNSNRQLNHRLTCKGLQKNFNKIEQMKNRQDEIKCFSSLLEFNSQKAKQYYEQNFVVNNSQGLQKFLTRESQIEEAYRDHLSKNVGMRDKLFVFLLIFLNTCLLIVNIILKQYTIGEIGLRTVGIVLLVCLFFLTKYIHKKKFVVWIIVVVYIYLLTYQKIDEMGTISQSTRAFSHYYAMMIVTLFFAISGVKFLHSVLMASLITLFAIISIFILGFLQIQSVYEWFYVTLVLIRKYVFQKESIINFRQGQKTAQISKELNKIVSQLLPKHAYEKLKTQNFENRLELTDLFEQCTILFADIKGFTEFSDRPENKAEPTNVVRMLRSLFQEFDLLCTLHNVYKVYTIGDCYVVLGFTNCYDRNPKKQAENVVNFGFQMIKTIQRVKRQKPELSSLNMRIGVHTGTIIGGIVGTEIVRYDIYGSDVVVANKFQETGMIGKIHISEQTKKLLDQLQKKPYPDKNIQSSDRVQIKKLNVSYAGWFIQRGNLS